MSFPYPQTTFVKSLFPDVYFLMCDQCFSLLYLVLYTYNICVCHLFLNKRIPNSEIDGMSSDSQTVHITRSQYWQQNLTVRNSTALRHVHCHKSDINHTLTMSTYHTLPTSRRWHTPAAVTDISSTRRYKAVFTAQYVGIHLQDKFCHFSPQRLHKTPLE